jgi:hypothetical protein
MTELLPGATLYGFCGGVFGRDSYEDKIVVAAGCGWLVAKSCNSEDFYFAQGDSLKTLESYTELRTDDDY